jgi:LacI family transcriptional regulator
VATIKDVAKLAGVGLGTASRVVSGKGSVSPATLEKVKKAIDELGFRPSHAARALLSGSSRMIGVYIPVLSGTFYTPILQIIDTELRAAGLHMVLAFGVGLGDERRQAIEGIEFLIERGCDGLIVMTSALLEEDIAALGLKAGQLVALNHSFDSIDPRAVLHGRPRAGRTAGGARAARPQAPPHRADRRPAPRSPTTWPVSTASPASCASTASTRTRSGASRATFRRPAAGPRPRSCWNPDYQCTALFCANDEMAVGALSYFQEAGMRVPHDLSVIGYDDTPSAAFSAPRLTSVHMPWREMTQNGVNALLNLCYDMKRPVTRDFPVSVTLRASLAKAVGGRRKAA